MTERDKIKERVAKLLNLTTDRGASEAEAMQAAERAAELMAHYDIQASELQIKSARAIALHSVIRRYGNLRIAVPVARHIATLCDCKYWLDAEHGVTFFGLPEDAEVASYLFDLISNGILAEMDIYRTSREYRSSAKNGRALVNAFINGMEDRIGERIEALGKVKRRTVQEATGRALVLVKEAQIEEDFAATGIRLVRGGGSYRWGAGREGYATGAAAGGRVRLSAGVKTGGTVGALR
jgi:hypothetical protein